MSADQNDLEHDGKVNNGVDGATAAEESHEVVHKPRKCECLFRGCHSCTKPLRTKYHAVPQEDSSFAEQFKYALLCPPHGKLAKYIMFVVMFFVAWSVLISVTGTQGLPGGNFFSLVVLFFACIVGGYLVVFIRMPPLLGRW